jgi:hypothetical protein
MPKILCAIAVFGLVVFGCGKSSDATPAMGSGGSAATLKAGHSGAGSTARSGTGGSVGPTGQAGMTAASGGSISGAVNGKNFASVVTALYAGKPDDPASTVVFVFDTAVQCGQVSAVGWDQRIQNGAQVLEMKMLGTTPMVYKVTTSATPAAGEASVNHAIATVGGTPPETSGSSGTVTLSVLTPMMRASGSYALMFPNGSLEGSFDATYCAGGVEP